MAAKLAITEVPKAKKQRAPQYVWDVTWEVNVEDRVEPTVQLVSGKTFQEAFFKARRWAKLNCTGTQVSMVVARKGMIL